MKKKKNKKEEIKLIDITKIRLAIELEVELPAKRDADKLIERGKTLKGWEIKGDPTLDNGIELSPENSNRLYYNEDSLMQIKEILALVRVYRGFIKPETCGLHIHVNVKNLTDKQILTIIQEFIHRQRFIAKKFNVHKSRIEDTCKLILKTELHHLTEKSIHRYRNSEGYSFRNFGYIEEKHYSLNAMHLAKGDYGTLEFRLFGGTLNFKEIKSIIYFVLTFIKDCLERE